MERVSLFVAQQTCVGGYGELAYERFVGRSAKEGYDMVRGQKKEDIKRYTPLFKYEKIKR